jgi:hypothetical protein
MAMLKFRAPALPLPSSEYEKEKFDQLTRALRIYFNYLDSTTPLQNDFYVGRGNKLVFPHIAASDSTDQVAGGNNTATVVKFDTLESGFGWTLNSPGSATAEYAGVYTIRYSLQLLNSANAIHFATVWLKVNTFDVANSATIFAVPAAKNNTTPSYVAAYSEVTFAVDVGDEIELYWATDLAGNPTTPTDGIYIFHDAAQTTPFARPAIPSAIGSIAFVSDNV